MKKRYLTVFVLTFIINASYYAYSCAKHSKLTDSLLNLIQKTEHNDLEKMRRFANELLETSEDKQAHFYGSYYLIKANFQMFGMEEAIADLVSLYNNINHKKYNYIKYEIDLLISEYYLSQDNFDAGFERLKKILEYGTTVDFKLAAYLFPDYSYLNVERAIEYIEKNINYSHGKFTNNAYFRERLKRGLLKLQSKYNTNKDSLMNEYEKNIENCINNGWTDLAIENMHSLIYVYGNDSIQKQLTALSKSNEAISFAKQLGSTHLLTKLYQTKGHVYVNLAGFYYYAKANYKDEKQLDSLNNLQLERFQASCKAYEQALRYAQIQQNSNRISRLYSAIASVKQTINTIMKSNEDLEEICTLYNCALLEMEESNFEAMRVLKSRILASINYFGSQTCLNEISFETYKKSDNKYFRQAVISIAKTDFERALFQHENTLNIKNNKSQIIRNALIIFIPLLLLSLVYYYRQKYLLYKQIERQNQLIKAQNNSLKQAVRRLERANRGLENFAFTAAHDIKSPLRSIASFTGLLKRKYYNPESEDNVLFFDYVIKGCEDLSHFVDNLLKFSTILHKKTPAQKIDLNEVLTKIRHRLKRTLEEEKVSLEIEESLPVLKAHTSLVYQLYYNLITNSIKFKRKDVQTVIQVGCILKDKEMEFYVKDNGIGIAPEKQREVFDLFKKLYANTEYNGFGIGLATCQKIVHYYKGRLRLKSKVGKETTIYFTLPRTTISIKPNSKKVTLNNNAREVLVSK